MLRLRFDAARKEAAEKATPDLAERIRKFQFRDIRAKAASDIEDLRKARDLLGHTEDQITQIVYRRKGQKVEPTR